MSEITVRIEIFCARCGAGLCNQTSERPAISRQTPAFDVEPCEECLRRAREEGYDDGHEKGYDEGLEEGSAEVE